MLGKGKRALTATSGALPAIGATEAEIEVFLDAVALAVGEDRLDPRKADTLKDLARTKLAAIRQKDERRKIAELQDFLKQLREVKAEGLSYAEAVRQHREEPMVGRWDYQEKGRRRIFSQNDE